MKHIEKIVKITQAKKNFKTMQKALTIIENYGKYMTRYEQNQLHVFDKKTMSYIITIGIGDYDELIMYEIN